MSKGTDGRELDYTPEQVTKALTIVVAHGGSTRQTVRDELAEAGLDIPVSTLRRWVSDVHADQYKQIDIAYGEQLEDEAVRLARANIQRAAELEAEMLERVGKIANQEFTPQALKAITDAKAKAVNQLLALTGRPTDGRSGAPDLAETLRSLQGKGLVKINVELGPAPAGGNDAGDQAGDVVDGTATEETG